jgi:hypothetical protein
MITITSDNQEVKLALERLVDLVTSNGGRLNSGIEITSSKGELSIISRLGRANHDEIIFIPEACLPTMDDFHISLEGDNMIARPRRKNNVSALHAEITNVMLNLFNLSGKISYHRNTFPLFSLSNAPNLTNHLGLAQPRAANDKPYAPDQEIIKSFFGSRVCVYENKQGAKKEVVMPIIDCLNHHHSSPGYGKIKSDNIDRRGMFIYNSKPLSSSNECFVGYNIDNDALGLYLGYGFVDTTTLILRSIPLHINLDGVGRIIVRRNVRPQVSPENIPPEAKDLLYYFPHIKRVNTNTLELSHLMIPPVNAPFALRRILAILIKILAPALDNNHLLKLVSQAEAQVLQQNNNFYTQLEILLGIEPQGTISPQVSDALLLLSKVQKDKLSSYKERLLN